MQHTTFGRNNGLRVSELALGTGGFSTIDDARIAPRESLRIYEGFREAGGTFIDTADIYGFGQSERRVGELVRGHRDDVVIATKFSRGSSDTPTVIRSGNGRKHVRSSVEASLSRLGTDYIDLLWVHFPDGLTPIEETLRGLDDLVTQGKILYAGLSNFPAWRTSYAVAVANLRGWAPVVGIQIEHSLIERSPDRELLPMAEALGLGAALWSPLGGGLLTGKYRHSDEGRLTTLGTLVHKEDTPHKTATINVLLEIASELEITPSQVAIAWLRSCSARSTAPRVPIIGPRTAEQLFDYLGANEVELDDDQVARLSDVSAITLGVPHDTGIRALDNLQGGSADAVLQPAIPIV